MAQVSTTLDVKELERLDRLAAVFNLSRSATVRVLLTGALKNINQVLGIMIEARENEDQEEGTPEAGSGVGLAP